jgi:hypothetical protein
MKKMLLTLLLASASVFSQAAVTQINTSIDSSKLQFKDSTTGLTWSNGNAFAVAGLTFADVSSAALAYGNEGWRLPTLEEFKTLYADLGSVAQASNSTSWGPFTTNGVQYWTSTPAAFNIAYYQYFMPQVPLPTDEVWHMPGTMVNTWLVTSVPEPQTYAMLLSGLGLMGAIVRRRKQNQV